MMVLYGCCNGFVVMVFDIAGCVSCIADGLVWMLLWFCGYGV